MIMNEINIKKIREKLNLSQEAFAERLGVHTRTVQNWESGGTIPKSKHAILCDLMNNKHVVNGGQHVNNGGQHVNNGDAVNGNKIIEERETEITEQTSALMYALTEITEMRKLLADAMTANQRTNDRLLTLLENIHNH